ncbi:helix-turn-helix transcriptional regulator [Curtobacterium caseinilyticum]|uniref:Helix-turn-helix transcriptional regulator n=1 Tax=Curtobacterium caseinilyticum TaxID=3055137 RepID=A0ABT7TUL6_9MICO|nr:helix-turn-helix transcriptional regulator [Curtobacterium caseinilyticum]MDM7893044.1 helix-turn-helix transcriptional regulator [Curtobacterium caseinilyticum]
MSDVTEQQRRELGAFLRARRERVSPVDVGLPGSSRRRTPGLRREELAMLAGISATWYTFLEQGRDVRPSRQVLDAIARALGLAGAERTHLFAIAVDEPAPTSPDQVLDPEVARVVDLLDPAPTYVTGATFDLLAWNTAAAELFRGALDHGEHPNLVRWVFLDQDARYVLPDWTDVAQGLLARLRARAGRHPGVAVYAELEADLRGASPEADRWWPRYDVGTPGAGIKRVRQADGQVQRLAYTSFDVADRPDQTMTTYRRQKYGEIDPSGVR